MLGVIQDNPQNTEPNNPSDNNLENAQETVQPTQTELIIEPEVDNKPGIIVLQWLTYAFWGWAIVAMGILVSAIFTTIVTGFDTSELTAYALAAILVLLPISMICDIFYTKHEPEKKSGAAMFVMVVHAVLFAILFIGTLIAVVYSMVNLIIYSGDNKAYQVAFYSSATIALAYLAVFLRTINPPQFFNIIPRIYKIFMLVFSLLVITGAILGPIWMAQQTKNDRLIESNIYNIKSSIDSYTQKNNKLPESLNQLNLQKDAKILVEKNLVIYKPGENKTSVINKRQRSDFVYELCATYKKASPNYEFDSKYEDEYGIKSDLESSNEENTNNIVSDNFKKSDSLTGPHPAGEKCYTQVVYSY